MTFRGIGSQIIILKPTENFIYSKFQITYQIIKMFITYVRSGVVSIICNVGSDVNKKQITGGIYIK